MSLQERNTRSGARMTRSGARIAIQESLADIDTSSSNQDTVAQTTNGNQADQAVCSEPTTGADNDPRRPSTPAVHGEVVEEDVHLNLQELARLADVTAPEPEPIRTAGTSSSTSAARAPGVTQETSEAIGDDFAEQPRGRKRSSWARMLERMMEECEEVARLVAEETGYTRDQCMTGFLRGAAKRSQKISDWNVELSLVYDDLGKDSNFKSATPIERLKLAREEVLRRRAITEQPSANDIEQRRKALESKAPGTRLPQKQMTRPERMKFETDAAYRCYTSCKLQMEHLAKATGFESVLLIVPIEKYHRFEESICFVGKDLPVLIKHKLFLNGSKNTGLPEDMLHGLQKLRHEAIAVREDREQQEEGIIEDPQGSNPAPTSSEEPNGSIPRVERVTFQASNAHSKRSMITEYVRKQLVKRKWIKEKSKKVPWALMHFKCWSNGYYWDGVPIELEWKEFRDMRSSDVTLAYPLLCQAYAAGTLELRPLSHDPDREKARRQLLGILAFRDESLLQNESQAAEYTGSGIDRAKEDLIAQLPQFQLRIGRADTSHVSEQGSDGASSPAVSFDPELPTSPPQQPEVIPPSAA